MVKISFSTLELKLLISGLASDAKMDDYREQRNKLYERLIRALKLHAKVVGNHDFDEITSWM